MNFHFSALTGPSGRALCQSAPLFHICPEPSPVDRVAITLKFALMQQPILLDDTDAYWVVSSLKLERDQLQLAEYLLNLEKRQRSAKLP